MGRKLCEDLSDKEVERKPRSRCQRRQDGKEVAMTTSKVVELKEARRIYINSKARVGLIFIKKEKRENLSKELEGD